jgi:alkanesulfonate monooxygenase SsuD/methylene tetrahydromethanopterin reductase-like flavin-dependent oxidoreductase (luciferase family)
MIPSALRAVENASAPATLEAGLQLHLPSYRDVSLRRLLDLGAIAHRAGVSQLWVTDNLQSRNAFVVLAALASRLPIRLGTAVLVQYFRNPVDVADAVAAIGELMDGRELSLGLARGNPSTSNLLRLVKPVTFLRETARALRRLLDGDVVQFADYPVLGEYFNLQPERAYRLNFRSSSPIRLYCGGNAPLSLAVGGATMDGIIFGWTFLAAARAGRLGPLLEIAKQAAHTAGRPAPTPRIAEIKLYVDRDDATARLNCKRAVASRIIGLFGRGYTWDEYARLGIASSDVERLFAAARGGASGAALVELITDAIVDALFVAGDPVRCREQLAQVSTLAREFGFQQLMFSELGPDVDLALGLLCEDILPSLPSGGTSHAI